MPTDITSCLRFLSRVQKIDGEMPLQQLMTLLVVADATDGLSLTEVANKVGVGLATASRYVGSLGKINRKKEEGLQFLESFEDPMERRKKIIRLTAKGKSAINMILGETNANI